MTISYTEQPDGSLMGLMDDVLITLRALEGNRYAFEVWIDDEVPAHRGEANGLEAAKSKVQDWLGEALSSTDAEG